MLAISASGMYRVQERLNKKHTVHVYIVKKISGINLKTSKASIDCHVYNLYSVHRLTFLFLKSQ